MYNIAKNCFARERSKKAIVITKKPHKKDNISCATWFYFFDITYMKKVLIVSKTIILKNFFHISDIKKIKTILPSQSFSFYEVKISFLSYNCNLFGSFLSKTVFDGDNTCGCSVILSFK